MRLAAQLQPGCEQNRINIHTGRARELKAHLCRLLTLRCPCQYPPTAGQQGSGQEAHQPLRLFGAQRPQIQIPTFQRGTMPMFHMSLIGWTDIQDESVSRSGLAIDATQKLNQAPAAQLPLRLSFGHGSRYQ